MIAAARPAAARRRGGGHRLFPALLLLLLSTALVITPLSALPIEGAISIAPGVEPPSTKVILNGGGRFATFTAADGSFLFPDVPAGVFFDFLKEGGSKLFLGSLDQSVWLAGWLAGWLLPMLDPSERNPRTHP